MQDALDAWAQKKVNTAQGESLSSIIHSVQMEAYKVEELIEETGAEWLLSVVDEVAEDIFNVSDLAVITMALRLGYFGCAHGALNVADLEERVTLQLSTMELQYAAYRVQEQAIMLFANSDVQMAVYKWLDEYLPSDYMSDAEMSAFELWNQLSIGLSNMLKDINCGKVLEYRMDLAKKIWDADSAHILSALLDKMASINGASKSEAEGAASAEETEDSQENNTAQEVEPQLAPVDDADDISVME